MQRDCVQCRQPFRITEDDLAFYDKVSPVFAGKKCPIPPPTHCPGCRLQRRMGFRNERRYYHRDCDLCAKSIISIYREKTVFPVYCRECWWSERWEGRTFGVGPDFTRPFFAQFAELQTRVPRLYFSNVNTENSDYCNHVDSVKNCYLLTGSIYAEGCLYGYRVLHSRDCVDCLWLHRCELCHECTDCIECYNLRDSQHCTQVRDSSDVVRCGSSSNLLFCVGQHQSHYKILNRQLTKEAFMEEKERIAGDAAVRADYARQFGLLKLQVPVPHMYGRLHENCTGNSIDQSANATECFDVGGMRDVRHCCDAFEAKDCQDLFSFYGPAELVYDTQSAGQGMFRSMFLSDCWPGSDLLYCDYCFHCEHCFGCTGLRHQKYCILNTQYAKDEYEALVPRIIAHMRTTGEWGEFFPLSQSPFAYNESPAQESYPLSREEVLGRGWRWTDYESPLPTVKKTIRGSDLPDAVADVPDDILDWAIECETTGLPYKIVRQELELYRKLGIPVPRRHPDRRHAERMKLRNPRHLWERTCMKCSHAVETTYSPQRPETVYCESCYRKEIY